MPSMIVKSALVAGLFAVATQAAPKNFLLIGVDDLRPMFGRSFGEPEVLTPNLDRFFLDGNGTAMQNSYVQIAVCGPSRASILTGRRPDTTHAGPSGGAAVWDWCWCERTNCKKDALFMTIPTYFAQHGFVTAGAGKIFHPDACTNMHVAKNFGADFGHLKGDDYRAWNHGVYGVEGRLVQPFAPTNEQGEQEQFGSIPGPFYPIFNGTLGPSYYKSNVTDLDQTDGQLATNTIQRLANFSKAGIGKENGKPFFLAVGFHKPHSPWIVPEKYFDLYDEATVSLPNNPNVPTGFKEENWYANGNMEVTKFTNEKVPFGVIASPGGMPKFNSSVFSFHKHVVEPEMRRIRQAYFAATSFLDAQAGRVLEALGANGYLDNTVVALWSDHGYHLGDTNSWCKETNFEKGTRNTLFWRVPGQTQASQGRNRRIVEMVDFFPTAVELMGLPKLATCEGIDQPPTVECLQGQSYADEFVPTEALSSSSSSASATAASAATATGAGAGAGAGATRAAAKTYAFSQWAYPPSETGGLNKEFRMGYTVRTNDGYRYTEYVRYSVALHQGIWLEDSADPELYVYGVDPDETTNFAADDAYNSTVTKLKKVLREQFSKRGE